MKHEEFFRKHPVFTSKEMAGYLSSCGVSHPRNSEILLAYHKKRGRLISVRRGLYAVVPPGTNPVSYSVDPFLIAAKLTKDAVLSHHTALEFHGYAYSVHENFIYSASSPLSPVVFRTHVFHGVRFSEPLRRTNKENFGVVTVDRSGMEVCVTSLERTMVDILNRPDLSGGWEEVWRSLESVEFFDLDEVIKYTLLLKNATAAARVGFFLKQHRKPLMVEEKHLRPLYSARPRQPHYLDRNNHGSNRFVSEWNLVVPLEIIEQTWKEVI